MQQKLKINSPGVDFEVGVFGLLSTFSVIRPRFFNRAANAAGNGILLDLLRVC